tara:strand:+ start:46 stop:1011 length:966 start_codon:yes stop_codon:yes gene_type:complete
MIVSCGGGNAEINKIEITKSITKIDGKEASIIKIGDLEVMTEDLGDLFWEDAKKECAKLGDGWRLPTKEELNILYENREEIGGFADNFYWSSMEFDNGYAWRRDFSYGFQFGTNKGTSLYSVRAVRSSVENKIENSNNLNKEKLDDIPNNLSVNVIDENYLIANEETMMDFFLTTLYKEMDVSQEEINEFINRTKNVTKLYTKKNQDSYFEEHIIIREQKQYSLIKTGQGLKENFDLEVQNYLSDTSIIQSAKLIRNQVIKLDNGLEYLHFKVEYKGYFGDGSKSKLRYNNNYLINIRDKQYYVITNTCRDYKLEELISIE